MVIQEWRCFGTACGRGAWSSKGTLINHPGEWVGLRFQYPLAISGHHLRILQKVVMDVTISKD